MKEVLCLATGKTYEIILSTAITAHPLGAPYPKGDTSYLIPIKRGGVLEYLYDVVEIVECYPDEIYTYSAVMSEENYANLCRYHEIRKATFGYSKEATKYRFYIIKEAHPLFGKF